MGQECVVGRDPGGRWSRLILVLLFVGFATAAQPQIHTHVAVAVPIDLLGRPVSLRDGIGQAHDQVTTGSTMAQRFYDQGLAYLHNYLWIEAARSFNQALRLDHDLALADVGLGVAYSEVNQREAARAAQARARALAPHVSGHEQQHIGIRDRQLEAEEQPQNEAKLVAYRTAIDQAVKAFPSDVELWLQRGIAESPNPADRGQSAVASAIPYFQHASALSPLFFAPHHYLTHAFENTGAFSAALDHGKRYSQLAPSVPHALHMYGHELRRTGHTEDAIGVFEQADQAELAYFARESIPAEYDWHYEHNLGLLAECYQYLGRRAKAATAFDRAFRLPTSFLVQAVNKRQWPAFLRSIGRYDDALTAARELMEWPNAVVQAAGHIEAGLAWLDQREFARAAAESNLATRSLREAPAGGALISRYLEQLQGEFYLRTGNAPKAMGFLRNAIAEAKALNGPDESIGAVLMIESIAKAARESGEWAFAAEAAHDLITEDAAYAGSHYAAALVADHEGDLEKAQAEFGEAERRWASADADLAEVITIRDWRSKHGRAK